MEPKPVFASTEKVYDINQFSVFDSAIWEKEKEVCGI